MSITATELKNNLSKYLMLASKEDIYITQYGKVVAKLTNPYQDRLVIAESLFGSVPATMTLEDAKDERLNSLTVPKLSARDSMTWEQFNATMEKGYHQAKAGQTIPLEEAFDRIRTEI